MVHPACKSGSTAANRPPRLGGMYTLARTWAEENPASVPTSQLSLASTQATRWKTSRQVPNPTSAPIALA